MAKLKHDNILSDDIVLFQILPRLPARSIGRFMSVCKQWHSFLKTPGFTKMHLHHVNSENRQKLLVISTAKPCEYFCTIDFETPEDEDGLTAIHSLPFEANNNEMWIISSLNGLVCIGIDRLRFTIKYNFSDIILWNPLMGEYKTLSKGNCSSIPARVYGLYYSSCDDDYKLLRITKSSDTYIYSWKSDSWRKAKSSVDPLLKFWYFGDRDILELWKMDGDGGWTKVVRFFNLLCGHQPLHLMKNGNWLMMHFRRNVYAYKFDHEGMRKKAKEVWRSNIDGTMTILQGGKFVETIVSL